MKKKLTWKKKLMIKKKYKEKKRISFQYLVIWSRLNKKHRMVWYYIIHYRAVTHQNSIQWLRERMSFLPALTSVLFSSKTKIMQKMKGKTKLTIKWKEIKKKKIKIPIMYMRSLMFRSISQSPKSKYKKPILQYKKKTMAKKHYKNRTNLMSLC